MKRAESILVEEDTFDIAHITGNASDEIKRTAGNPSYFFTYLRPDKVKSPIFGSSIQKRLKVTEISINKKQEEESKLEARIVLEIDVTEEMLNGGGSVHGGCYAFLVDLPTDAPPSPFWSSLSRPQGRHIPMFPSLSTLYITLLQRWVKNCGLSIQHWPLERGRNQFERRSGMQHNVDSRCLAHTSRWTPLLPRPNYRLASSI